jgi:hypothetical protein
MPIRIRLREFEQLPPDQQQAVFNEALSRTRAAHGQMSNVAHYVGCALTIIIVLLTMMTGQSIFVAILAGIPAYFGSLAVGFFLWRRSISFELEKVIRQVIAARAR